MIGNFKSILIRLLNSLALLLMFFSGCDEASNSNEKLTGYNLSNPDESYVLPDILQEVSGLTSLDSVTFACIQDENGILFIYDLVHNEITKQYTFNIDGDYEGIARVDSTIYVLRSDGTLFEISDYQSPDFILTSYFTGIPANNNEGLCYDPDNNRLLIACKGKPGKGSEFKDKRLIYGFDLATKVLTTEPVFDFNLQTIKQFAMRNEVDMLTKTKKKKKQKITEPVIRFMTSAIAVHPVTKKLYLLSASDHLFFIFNMNGDIEHIEQLNPEIFNKAEGITFVENYDLLITNEGQDKKPTLLRFVYKPITTN